MEKVASYHEVGEFVRWDKFVRIQNFSLNVNSLAP